MAYGGKRPGAGRPKGPTLPRFADFVSPEEKEKFKEFMLDSYMGDMRLTLWMADQLYGKAPQAIDITGEVSLSLIDEEIRVKANGAISAILPQGDTE